MQHRPQPAALLVKSDDSKQQDLCTPQLYGSTRFHTATYVAAATQLAEMT
jgi:hypothetical protein